jgi:N-methylhydantoinase A/oxoprolinase/acetone carboxylase beta subunit
MAYLGIDRGGTFTDVVCYLAGRPLISLKLLSSDSSTADAVKRVQKLIQTGSI